uniref:Uncharacterized protein n=1 Tax=Candidatus Kentrum sp. SD TaxID=2126332 RepID=A0A451BLZ9_9GAMM|nr:MAG: hypothetical protein BECKSD772F_GA0070984_100357 [Candidatus Kentron sp. SD]VFK39565.1 MAG: hypothetical protein BECKSD772E_GA0070983_100317 [Candidatus Kentron sp. SD]VFK79331.1 MAG: hypothetical protein BECKSD772D_GA0070982_104514 [Candidatus Kentron sp. SD]
MFFLYAPRRVNCLECAHSDDGDRRPIFPLFSSLKPKIYWMLDELGGMIRLESEGGEDGLMYRKNKDSEKTGARARNAPLGAYCYALTNKRT